MVPPQPSELTLEMKRVLPAAPSVVFAAFSDPDKLAKWWGPEDFTVPSLRFDPRVRASYASRCSRRRAIPSISAGSSERSTPPSRLAFTFVYDEPNPHDVDTLVELSLRDLGDSTEVVYAQGPFKTAARRELHWDGWTDSFAKLEQFVSRQ